MPRSPTSSIACVPLRLRCTHWIACCSAVNGQYLSRLGQFSGPLGLSYAFCFISRRSWHRRLAVAFAIERRMDREQESRRQALGKSEIRSRAVGPAVVAARLWPRFRRIDRPRIFDHGDDAVLDAGEDRVLRTLHATLSIGARSSS